MLATNKEDAKSFRRFRNTVTAIKNPVSVRLFAVDAKSFAFSNGAFFMLMCSFVRRIYN